MTSAISIDDVRGQLLEECRNGAVVRYFYDAVGNRIRKTEDEKETRYHYNQKNQLLQKEDADGISCFTYDRQGGIIEEKTAAGIRRFTYNSLHQQTQVETETGNIQKNRYDAEGLRYELIENGRGASFVYHNGELLYEKGEEAGLSQEATSYHLGAGIEAFQRDSKTFYYHQDEQLNTTLISDEKAAIRNHYQYDAFGAGLDAVEALPNRIRYTGQRYDGQTGQYYLRVRYHNPVLGRFMQEDVYQGDGLNLYAYCRNNPVVYYDPSGYDCGGSGKFNEDGGTESIKSTDSKINKLVEDIIQRAKKGDIRRGKGYHGRLGDKLEQEMLSIPDAVYLTNNKEKLIFRKEYDVAIVDAKGSNKRSIITSYDPSGPRGKSGADIYGGSPSDPGMPVTHEQILSGTDKPKGGKFPPATQIR